MQIIQHTACTYSVGGFKEMSESLADALENLDYDDETLYLHYCPMANNSEGANWINKQEKIANPYMGSTDALMWQNRERDKSGIVVHPNLL